MHRIEAENIDYDSGVNLFKTTPPYTVMTPEWCNSIQEEIMNCIEQSGLPILGQANDTRNQLWSSIRRIAQGYDYIVDSQTTFVALFTRSGANSYDIFGDYTSVYFKGGRYEFSNVLSGGDTWGNIYTNNCVHIEFEEGAYIDFANAPGNITVETAGCFLSNVDVRGAGSVASAITNSYKLAANHVTFDNCKTSQRLSNTTFNGFEGSGTTLHNQTSKYINCSAYTLDSSGTVSGFKTCRNLVNCIAYDIDCSAANNAYGFNTCTSAYSCGAVNIASVGGSAAEFVNSTYSGVGASNNLYLWNYENTDLIIGTNNTARLYVKNDGKIGNLSSPAAPLEIADASSNLGIRVSSSASSSGIYFYVGDVTAGNRNWGIRNRYNMIGTLEFCYGNSLGADPTLVAMNINNNGYIGIGNALASTGASNPLHVQSTTTPQVRISYDAGSYATIGVADGGSLSITCGEATGYISVSPGAGLYFIVGNGAGISLTNQILYYSSDSLEWGTIQHNGTNLVIGTGGTNAGNIVISNTTEASAGTAALVSLGGIYSTKKIIGATSIEAGTTLTAGTGITATTGNIVATAGYLNSGKGRRATGQFLSSQTLNSLFDALDTLIPTNPDEILVHGGYYDGSNLRLVSSIRRIDSDTMRMYTLTSSGTYAGVDFDDGSSTTYVFNLSW